MMQVLKEGYSPRYGACYIEGDGVWFWVHIGQQKYGPYRTLTDAMREYHRWCLN